MTTSIRTATTRQPNPPPADQFSLDVIEGLSRPQKKLSSMYLYDDAGSQLFDQITEQPEYYLTRTELEIIRSYGARFFAHLGNEAFNLFELGCGNGDKTIALFKQLQKAQQHCLFYPIDISQYAIDGLMRRIHQAFPLQRIDGQQGDYQQLLPRLKSVGLHSKNVVLFLGSNIGNYSSQDADSLLQDIYQGLNPGDLLLMGLDLTKDYQTMLAAYNDEQGMTRQFNLNLLQRMNQELGADFDLGKFQHYEIYNPLEQAMQSFLVATEHQTVTFKQLNFQVNFDAHEALWVESSHKYGLKEIDSMARRNGFEVVRHYTDSRQQFVDSLWQRL
ncbi:L-histidine N(alpha)-methyltransferase [Aestuariicella hydrocarbonica]|uniref:L-histidine N(Alpha)-methyltransferase n=1 Tax=Pseudomaricurvus hydrocarbonicus TaxID=1470433 RepID=A0A9E5T471_9GAMM|nr:L-histidine N(alpha)-methyltransferase [Aestuariicella hydrocarbonica]NHO67624.1 L-histidine N(alpha)-methyltransferase [Aestuariicella hydrocarbonica]